MSEVSESEKKKEDWMNSKWRPMMGWMYMSVCVFDFVLAPILWSMLQAVFHGGVNVQWQPLTLQGAGLFHIAMGAVLGIAAMGRTQEKLAGANNGGAGGTSYTAPAPISSPSPSTSVTPAPSWGTTPVASPFPSAPVASPFPSAPVATPLMSSSGKLAPQPAQDPVL
jgi:hypothetical protein